MELNKIFASVLLAGIIAMASGFIADKLVSPQQPSVSQLAIDMDTAPAATDDEPEELPPIRPLLASADPSAGESLIRACASCHSFDEGGANQVGPNLWGVVGAPMAHLDDFNYSSALQARADEGGEWTFESMNAFLENPRGYVSGTSMSYAGMRSAEDRANLIAYMNEQSNDPLPLPDPAEIEAEAEAAEAEAEAEEADEEDGAEDDGNDDNGDENEGDENET